MNTVESLDGQAIGIRYSIRSRVPYVVNWEDNVLRPPRTQVWPDSLLRQVKRYPARKEWFAVEDAEALAAPLGRISKFQSLNSEDAVTWSWFGTLGCASARTRQAAVQWLYDRLNLGLTASSDVMVDQWARVIHPNAPVGRRGPELDARIDDPAGALIYVEAKWGAVLGVGKGAVEGTKDDQLVLRRDAFRAEPALYDDSRPFVVLGVSNEVPSLAAYKERVADPAPRPVAVAWLTWADLAGCAVHPRAADFRRYLGWKRALSKTAWA